MTPHQAAGRPAVEDADVALMIAVRDHGCTESFDQLVRRWRARVERMCYRMCGNLVDAEDLAQDVFQKLFQARDRYHPTASFSSYLWKIATNRCRDFGKSQRQRRRQTSNWEDVAEAPVVGLDGDARASIQQAIWRLPRHYREVVVLRHYEDLKFDEMAALLEIPRGTVASRMAKALRLLEAEFVRLELIPARTNPGSPKLKVNP
jgi:RNA polymerase sigma-70 factor (ECF subfamily)